MSKIQQYIAQLSRVTPEAQEAALLEIIRANQSYILDLNTGQLFSGKDSDGNDITPAYRNPRYAELKLQMNPAGVVDLFFTGAFYRGWFLTADSFPVLFDSSDEKTGELMAKYGEKIFGLTQASKQDLREQLKSQILDYYRTVYQLQ